MSCGYTIGVIAAGGGSAPLYYTSTLYPMLIEQEDILEVGFSLTEFRLYDAPTVTDSLNVAVTLSNFTLEDTIVYQDYNTAPTEDNLNVAVTLSNFTLEDTIIYVNYTNENTPDNLSIGFSLAGMTLT